MDFIINLVFFLLGAVVGLLVATILAAVAVAIGWKLQSAEA